mmetsp:Transcript_79360/g.164760  ORF Transcript_79360/g.164760 Transcript_79360/m.164760 type:complete len:93 (-) Transcript_79360:91-369(-)
MTRGSPSLPRCTRILMFVTLLGGHEEDNHRPQERPIHHNHFEACGIPRMATVIVGGMHGAHNCNDRMLNIYLSLEAPHPMRLPSTPKSCRLD